MKINVIERKIVLSMREVKAASCYGSDMYYKVSLARKDYPGFDVVVNKNYRDNQTHGLTYDVMEAEIRAFDEDGTLLEEFFMLRYSAKSYGYVVKWYTTKMAYYKYVPEAV